MGIMMTMSIVKAVIKIDIICKIHLEEMIEEKKRIETEEEIIDKAHHKEIDRNLQERIEDMMEECLQEKAVEVEDKKEAHHLYLVLQMETMKMMKVMRMKES